MKKLVNTDKKNGRLTVEILPKTFTWKRQSLGRNVKRIETVIYQNTPMTKMKELQQRTMWLAKISYLILGKGVKTLTDVVYKLNTYI